MFFFIFPSGTRGNKIRPLIAWVIACVLLYRVLMSLKFPQLQVQIINFLPGSSWNFELLSAMLQSLVTPVVPARALIEHKGILTLAIPFVLGFWLLFGGGLEAALGRLGLAVFYLAGACLGVALLIIPGVSMNAAFWLGHASTLFCLGACYLIFLDVDVKMYYIFWSFMTGGNSGTWEIPSLFFLIPLHLLLIFAQSMFWYSMPVPPIPTHDGLFTPIAWSLVLPMAGFGATLLWLKYARKPQVARRSDPIPAY